MKLKKKAKLTIIGVALILIIALAAIIAINFMPKKEKVWREPQTFSFS